MSRLAIKLWRRRRTGVCPLKLVCKGRIWMSLGTQFFTSFFTVLQRCGMVHPLKDAAWGGSIQNNSNTHHTSADIDQCQYNEIDTYFSFFPVCPAAVSLKRQPDRGCQCLRSSWSHRMEQALLFVFKLDCHMTRVGYQLKFFWFGSLILLHFDFFYPFEFFCKKRFLQKRKERKRRKRKQLSAT